MCEKLDYVLSCQRQRDETGHEAVWLSFWFAFRASKLKEDWPDQCTLLLLHANVCRPSFVHVICPHFIDEESVSEYACVPGIDNMLMIPLIAGGQFFFFVKSCRKKNYVWKKKRRFEMSV